MTHIVDTFGGSAVDLGSHTPDSGGPWTNIDADTNHLKTSGSNSLNATTTATGDGSYAVDVGSADMWAEMTLGSFTQIPTNGLGLAVRVTDKNNFYGVARASTSACAVVKRAGGTFTTFNSNLVIPNRNTGDLIRIEVVSNVLTIYNNGVSIYSVTDNTGSHPPSSTQAGFYTHNTTAGTNILTKFEADVVGGGDTTITLAQASWGWTGNAADVNAKTTLALAQAAWSWAGFAAEINARTMLTLARAGWTWAAGAVEVSGDVLVTLAQASWGGVANAVSANAKTAVALAQASWQWSAEAVSVTRRIQLARAAWRWTGKAISFGQERIGRLLMLLGVGQ